jgi:hypothetical protein
LVVLLLQLVQLQLALALLNLRLVVLLLQLVQLQLDLAQHLSLPLLDLVAQPSHQVYCTLFEGSKLHDSIAFRYGQDRHYDLQGVGRQAQQVEQ